MELDQAIREAFADFDLPAQDVISRFDPLVESLCNVVRRSIGEYLPDDAILSRVKELAISGDLRVE